MSTGLVYGRFSPLHLGHKALLDFANEYSDHLSIVVFDSPRVEPDVEIRMRWLRDLYPEADVRVVVLQDRRGAWFNGISNLFDRKPDLVFARDVSHGLAVAEVLGAAYVPYVAPDASVDLLSSKTISEDVYEYWDHLAYPSREYYAKRVRIVGPELVGKTSLTEALAGHFSSNWVPAVQHRREVAADYLSAARQQREEERKAAITCNRVTFVDSDILTNAFDYEYKFRNSPDWDESVYQHLRNLAAEQHYDLTFLLAPDLPVGIGDQKKRNWLFSELAKNLHVSNRPFSIISGSPDRRFSHSVYHTINIFRGVRA